LSGGKIDSHAHLYSVRMPEGAPNAPRDDQMSTVDEHIERLAKHGIAGSLLVQPTYYGHDHTALLEALVAGAGRFKGVAALPVDATREQLSELKKQGILGVRFLIGPSPDPLGSATGRRMLQTLAELDMFAEIDIMPKDLAVIEALRQSEAKVIIDHLGWPDVTQPVNQAGFREILELGKSDRAFMKISNVVRVSRQPYPFDDIEPFVRAVIDAFTIDRCLWGSAWAFRHTPPGAIDYGRALGAFEHHVTDAAARDAILVKNPARIFGFDLAPVSAA
jgi:predicted TIM-barrel fold metal-dependent hydrolase